MPGNTCAFRGCHSKEGQGISMFSFPKDLKRVPLWIEACHRTDLIPKTSTLYKNYKLCELHFEEKYISKGSTRKRLLPNAQPTIFPKKQEGIKGIGNSLAKSEEPPKKVIILPDILLKSDPAINSNESYEQPSLDTYFAHSITSGETICETMTIIIESEKIERNCANTGHSKLLFN